MNNDTPALSLKNLKLKYDGTINDKISHLTELVKSTQQDPEHIQDLKVFIHKIGGSAGSFGYASVSTLCKEMEIEINHRMVSGNNKDREWLSSLDTFIKKVNQEFQTSSFNEPLSPPQQSLLVRKPSLYVIDDDVDFLDLLERIKGEFPIELSVEFDPQKAIDKLNSTSFNPYGIVVAQTFRSPPITGFDIIKAQSQKNISPSPLFGLLLEKENIDARMEAIKNGINYIFHKPVSAFVLLKAMSEALESKSLNALEVLVVDDDPDFCDFVTSALAEIGISTHTTGESSNLFKTLEEYKPNILLLDLVLPKYDGFNLLKTLRQDVTYKNLFIIIVTSSEQQDISLNAYEANVDDILFKPISKKILQKRILNIAERWISSKEATENYTGLPSLRELMNELNESQKKSEFHDSCLVLFEVQDFSNWIKQNGYAAAKDLMIYISNQLQWEADYMMKCFLYQSSIFAIVFHELDLDVIERQMYSFLSQLVQKQNRWNLSFNCSIVPISKSFGNALKIFQTAEECLSEASKKEAASVKIVHRLPQGELAKREIMIIDSDNDLLKILKRAFESHGIVVKTYSEGGLALKELLNRRENNLPSLMIVERNLSDMDGMYLFNKLKTRFRTKIPFIILTVFSSDKDISEGIKQGVVEYIVKPFNISILVQKSLQIIFKAKIHSGI